MPRALDPNSLRGRVVALVEALGAVTVDDLIPHCDGVSRDALIVTMNDCAKAGRLVLVGYGKRLGRGRGRKAATFDLAGRGVPAPREQAPAPAPCAPPVNSVFALGALA